MEHTNLLLMEELKSASSMSRWRWTNTGKYNSHTWSHVEFCSSRTSSGEFFFWTHFRLSLCKLHQLRMRSYGRHTPNSRANGYSFSLAANSELKWGAQMATAKRFRSKLWILWLLTSHQLCFSAHSSHGDCMPNPHLRLELHFQRSVCTSKVHNIL